MQYLGVSGFIVFLIILFFHSIQPVYANVIAYLILAVWFVAVNKKRLASRKAYLISAPLLILVIGLAHKYLFGRIFQYETLLSNPDVVLLNKTWWIKEILRPTLSFVLFIVLYGAFFSRKRIRNQENHYLTLKGASVPVFTILVIFAINSQNVTGDRSWLGTLSESVVNEKPNVILISWDTVRQDHLSVYGYHRETTPRLEEFAESANLYSRFFATTGLTVPSHTSIFTGRLPYVHGVLDHQMRFMLSSENRTAAEIFNDNGYFTAAITSHQSLRPCNVLEGFKFIQDRSFNSDLYAFDSFMFNIKYGENKSLLTKLPWPEAYWKLIPFSAEQVTNAAVNWLKKNSKRNFFLFVHYVDPHNPYTPLEPYTNYFESSTLDERYTQLSESWKDTVNCYDSEIAYLDFHHGRLLDYLKEMALYDNSLIIVLSDHGEGFYEHDWFQHGACLYNEVALVPLLIKYPFQDTAAVVERPASHIDVLPTILETIGLELPDDIQGTSVNSSQPAEPVVIEGYFLDDEAKPEVRRSLVDYPVKLHVETDGSLKLYDLKADKAETTDLSTEKDSTANAMNSRLEATLTALDSLKIKPIKGSWVVTPEQLKQMKALGYVK